MCVRGLSGTSAEVAQDPRPAPRARGRLPLLVDAFSQSNVGQFAGGLPTHMPIKKRDIESKTLMIDDVVRVIGILQVQIVCKQRWIHIPFTNLKDIANIAAVRIFIDTVHDRDNAHRITGPGASVHFLVLDVLAIGSFPTIA